ncbi:MAG: hypothetical protein ACREB3_03520, partial [Burkholderiales bacterium]
MLIVINNRHMRPVAVVTAMDQALAWAETVPVTDDFSIIAPKSVDLGAYTVAELRCLHGYLTRRSYLAEDLARGTLINKVREALETQPISAAAPTTKQRVAPLNQTAWDQLMKIIEKQTSNPMVYGNAKGQTCVLLSQVGGSVTYLPLSIDDRLATQVLPATKFHKTWTKISYPVKHAVR